MPKGYPIDTEALHELLWARADRRGVVTLVQAALAAEMDITKFTMSRHVARLVDEERIRRISNVKQNGGKFLIVDPEVWRDLHAEEL